MAYVSFKFTQIWFDQCLLAWWLTDLSDHFYCISISVHFSLVFRIASFFWQSSGSFVYLLLESRRKHVSAPLCFYSNFTAVAKWREYCHMDKKIKQKQTLFKLTDNNTCLGYPFTKTKTMTKFKLNSTAKCVFLWKYF